MLRQVRTDPKLQLILAAGLIIQLITCYTQLGAFQSDQHYQIIEFSQYQLGKPSAAEKVWELAAKIRPTIQVYWFSGYYLLCESLNITDPYSQLTILRFITGLTLFFFFNFFTLYFLRRTDRKILYWALLILNFCWCLPYTRTLFNSEMMSSLFFFGAVWYYDVKKEKRNALIFILAGFLLALAFYLRFQAGFSILGFGLWLLFFDKRYEKILPLAIGFLLGVAINIYLDYRFYHQWEFTPYNYFYSNLYEGKANSFGTSSFVRYLLLIINVITLPPLSLFLIFYFFKSSVTKYRHLLFLPVILFIVGHCIIAHKEERFLFPVFNIFPVLVAWGLPLLAERYQHWRKGYRRFFRICLYITVFANCFTLVFLMFFVYAQPVEFLKNVRAELGSTPAVVYCVDRSPVYRGKLPQTFYTRANPNIEYKKIPSLDSLSRLQGTVYYATTFKQIEKERDRIDSLGFKPVVYSSKFSWELNEFFLSAHLPRISDSWILYRKP